MEVQTLLPTQVATTTRSGMLIPHSPVRVFLLSDHTLLRESLARVLRSHASILLMGAEEFSAAMVAEVIGSACDVLLVDSFIMALFDAQILDRPSRFSNLRILKIEMEWGIADLILRIVAAASEEGLFGGPPRLSSR